MHFNIYIAACACTELGDFDGAFAALEDCIANQNQAISWFKFDPILDPLRVDPRYAEIMLRLGFPD